MRALSLVPVSRKAARRGRWRDGVRRAGGGGGGGREGTGEAQRRVPGLTPGAERGLGGKCCWREVGIRWRLRGEGVEERTEDCGERRRACANRLVDAHREVFQRRVARHHAAAEDDGEGEHLGTCRSGRRRR